MKLIFLGIAPVFFAVALGVSPAKAADDWIFSLSPYIWLPTVDGQVKYSIPPGTGGSPNVDTGPSSYLENLDFALMLAGEARKGRWSVLGDLVYLDFSDSEGKTVSVNLPDGSVVPVIDAGTETGLKGSLVTLAPGYSVYSTPTNAMDIVAGLRYLAIRTEVDWRITGPVGAFPESGSRNESQDVWDGIVGVRGRARLGESQWSVPYYIDVGAGTSDLTWQTYLAVSYGFSWGDLTLAYRHLAYDFGSDDLLNDLSFSGPAVGASFRF